MAFFKKNDELSEAFAAMNERRDTVEAVYDGKGFIYNYPFVLKRGDVVIIKRTGEKRDVRSAKLSADANALFNSGNAVETADDFTID